MDEKHRYPRGTVLKWTRAAMARAHRLSPHDRMVVTGDSSNTPHLLHGYVTLLYDARECAVRQTNMVVLPSGVQPADETVPVGLRIDVREMRDDPAIPGLIAEFQMERA